MKKLMQWLRREKGQDLTEYALIIGLIVLLAIGALQIMGTSIQSIMDRIATALNAAAT
jgi:Flp pilus assembly pilin Flp